MVSKIYAHSDDGSTLSRPGVSVASPEGMEQLTNTQKKILRAAAILGEEAALEELCLKLFEIRKAPEVSAVLQHRIAYLWTKPENRRQWAAKLAREFPI